MPGKNPKDTIGFLCEDIKRSVGKSLIAWNFEGSGLIPLWLMMCPANSISSPISSFLRNIVMLWALHLSSTMLILDQMSSAFVAHMIMSSTIFMHHSRPLTATSERRHHSSDDAFRPIGARRYRKRPCGRRNVVRYEDSSSSGVEFREQFLSVGYGL